MPKIEDNETSSREENPVAKEWGYEAPRQNVDLNSEEYTEKFRNAEIFAKKVKVESVQVTEEGLANGEYPDTRRDDNGGGVCFGYLCYAGEGRWLTHANNRKHQNGPSWRMAYY